MESRRSMLRWVGAGLGGACVVALGGVGLDAVSRDRPSSPDPPGELNRSQAVEETAPGTAHFVSPSGDDDAPGSRSRPFETVEAALELVAPGDLIVLRGGVYNRTSALDLSGTDGTAERRIVLTGHPGERPVIRFDGPDPGGWSADGGVRLDDTSYWTIRNLTVERSPYLGLKLSGEGTSHVLVRDVEVAGNYLAGLGVHDGASNNELVDVVAYDNFDSDAGGRDADGIQFNGADDNAVRGGVCYGNSDDGIDLWRSRRILVEDCRCWANGRGPNGDGNGFKLGGGNRRSGEHDVHRNVAFANRAAGFDQNGAELPVEVFNNTAVGNGTDYAFGGTPHVLTNNIATDGPDAVGSDVVDRYNTWNLDITNPRFAGMTPGDSSFFRLTAESPCIDSGTDVGLAYAGPRPDLGAFEFRSGFVGRG